MSIVSLLPLVRRASRTTEEWISLVRVTVLLGLIPALWFGVIPVMQPAVNGIIVLFGGYIILLAVGHRWIPLLRKPDVIVATDILVVTLVVIISGTLNSPFLYLYYLTILEAAARLNLRQAIAASLAMAGLVVLLWARAGETAALETTGFRLGAIIAGGFFLALFLSAVVQDYRAAHERALQAEEMDRRLKRATAQLEEQLKELQSYNDLAGRLSGELRVDGVSEILLDAFLNMSGLARGAAYLVGEDGIPHFAAARGSDWARSDAEVEAPSFPTLPTGATGGEVLVDRPGSASRKSEMLLAWVPLIRAGSLRGWLCGSGNIPDPFPEPVLRRLRGMASQGVSALEAARLYEEVQRMASVSPGRALYPWNGVPKLIAEEIRRCTELVLVFSLAVVQLENYGEGSWNGDQDRDLALRRVVKLLQSSLRRVDVIAHDGAGRFVLLLARVSKLQAVEILRRLSQKMEDDSVAAQLLEVDRLLLTTGVVTFPEDGSTASDLLDKVQELVAQGPTTPSRVYVPAS